MYSHNDTSLSVNLQHHLLEKKETHISHAISLSHEGISIFIFSDNFRACVDKIRKYLKSTEVQNEVYKMTGTPRNLEKKSIVNILCSVLE